MLVTEGIGATLDAVHFSPHPARAVLPCRASVGVCVAFAFRPLRVGTEQTGPTFHQHRLPVQALTSTNLDEILARLRATQHELEQELDRLLEEKRAQFRYRLHLGRVVFEKEVRRRLRRHRTGLWEYLRRARVGYLLSAPVIYGMAVPMVILDASVTLYQHLCFRIYGIPRVRRGPYLVIDRQYLAYLNAVEKLNCMYCGYANGLIEYVREVTARTEQFWCPIKHARRTLDGHRRNAKFFDYGDAEAYRRGLEPLRKDW